MPHDHTITVYDFDELNDAAKTRARAWFLEGLEFATCYARDLLEGIAADLYPRIGVTLNTYPVTLMNGTTRQDAAFFWTGFDSQGDGLCFAGLYAYAPSSVTRVRAYAPRDKELHAIARRLLTVQRTYGYHVTATIAHRGHYAHERCTAIEVDANRPMSDTHVEQVREALRDLMRWTYAQLRAEYEYQTADAQVDDAIRANEYQFTLTGKIV